MTPQDKKRAQLLLLAALFLIPFFLAVVLRFSGWEPPRTRNYGELIEPPLPMHAVQARTADGTPWVFENTDRQWSLLVMMPASCDAACEERLDLLTRVRQTLGRHAPKLHLFALAADPAVLPPPIRPLQLDGELPAPLAQSRPDRLPELWMVDPHGFLVMAYPAEFDPSGLRRDLGRLVR